MNKRILVTGASGSIGGAVAEAVLKTGNFDVRLILRDKPHNRVLAAKFTALYGRNVEILTGDVLNSGDCAAAVDGVDYVLHFAAVVPPVACHNPEAAEKINYFGTKNLVDAIKASGRSDEIKFVEVGSMAQYGNRNYLHPWARVGDPLIPSYFDCYAVTKSRAERYVVESGLKYWLALRVSGVLHDAIVNEKLNDGLILYTPLSAPVELITLKDATALFKNLVIFDAEGTLAAGFWRNVYNAGGGASSRLTGYGLFEKGFSLMNAHVEKLMEPYFQPVRNYFTCWYADGDILNGYLNFRSQGADEFFEQMKLSHAYYKLAKPFSPLVKKFYIGKLMKSTNSPAYWLEHGMTDRVKAFFVDYDVWGKLPRSWKDYPVMCKGKVFDKFCNIAEVDYKSLINPENADKYKLSHGYDESKPLLTLGIGDFDEAAAFRGGKCLTRSAKTGDLHTLLSWECASGHVFKATAYGVLKAGYWCRDCCTPAPWNFDETAKSSPFYAQVWYDSHLGDENMFLTADCYRDIPREDERDVLLSPPDKIKKYRKG